MLDGRVKRRIRRNGLSEEMNIIYAERRRRANETKAQVERLKAELAEKDEEIERLHDETIEIDSERIWGLEQQIATLKEELAAQSRVRQQQQQAQEPTPDNSGVEASVVERDPFTTSFRMDLDSQFDIDGGVSYGDDDEADDDQFGESTLADLVSSTPTRSRRAAGHVSFPSPPSTSPTSLPEEDRPHTPSRSSRKPPSALRQQLTPTPSQTHSHASVQTSSELDDSSPDTQLQTDLESELVSSLRQELQSLTSTIESYSSLATKFSSSPSSLTTPQALESLLTSLTNELTTLQSQILGLGFPGTTPLETLSTIHSAFRTARLELEYLTPGEIALPLTSSGAAVLDLLLEKLRDLGRLNKEKDDAIDEYHSIEQSLRAQLGARVDAMRILSGQLEEREGRVRELEWGIEELRRVEGGVVKDLEGRLEGEAARAAGVKNESEERRRMIQELEGRLEIVITEKEGFEIKVDECRREVEGLEKTLQERNARVMQLEGEVERVGEELKGACETVRKLRVENGRLEKANEELEEENEELVERVEDEKMKAREVMNTLGGLVNRMGEGLRTPPQSSRKRRAARRSLNGEEEGGGEDGLLSGEAATNAGKGNKRRRYDSGMGLLEEDEVDVDA